MADKFRPLTHLLADIIVLAFIYALSCWQEYYACQPHIKESRGCLMPRNPDNEYSIAALRKQIDVALANLPVKAKDETADLETRREWALKQLLHTLELYTGSKSAMLVGNVPEGLTPSQEVEVAIYFFLMHEWSIKRDVRPIIAEYIERAISKKP
jgi:hypothetical protein